MPHLIPDVRMVSAPHESSVFLRESVRVGASPSADGFRGGHPGRAGETPLAHAAGAASDESLRRGIRRVLDLEDALFRLIRLVSGLRRGSGSPCGLLLAATLLGLALGREAGAQSFDERLRFPAEEAHQAVAVDHTFFYAIDNRAIGKYEKATGRRVASWRQDEGGPIVHLNSGVVVGDRLYCAHSNFPGMPMVSSVEVWDTRTLEHVASHSFGVFAGSGTWLDRHGDAWWMTFAHYAGTGGEPGKGPEWTTLVRLDDSWQPREAWVFPPDVVARFDPYSSSGGAWGPDGRLYVTGHDRPEAYVLQLPEAGSVLTLVEVLPVPIPGQGIAWDRTVPGHLYGIDRGRREVVVVGSGRY